MASSSGIQFKWVLPILLSLTSCCIASLIGLMMGQVSSFGYSIIASQNDMTGLSFLLSMMIFCISLLLSLGLNLLVRRLAKRSK